MRDGRLVQFGSQTEVYRRPRDTYVATFVGKPRMSLAEGSLEMGDGRATFVMDGVRIGLGSAAALGLRQAPPAQVTLGVRAEDLVVTPGGPDDPGTFPAIVRLTEPVGSDTFLELEAGPATFVARVPPDIDVSLGQAVRARIAPGRAHLFDTRTSLRLEQATDG
jgi:multiple sugar transport system ATP-binding protein